MRSGSHSAAISGWARSAGTAAKVMVIGQQKPASAWLAVMNRAPRATCAPSRGSRQGSAWSSSRTPASISRCQDPSKSTRSTRLP